MTVAAIVQARVGSVRLPRKALLFIAYDAPLLSMLIWRLKQAKSVDKLCVATTRLEEDKAIVRLAVGDGVPTYCGPTDDVLARYVLAARYTGLHDTDVVVRITGDNPLVCPEIVDDVVWTLQHGGFNYVGTDETYPEGLDVEAFTVQALNLTDLSASRAGDREHVTPWMRRELPRRALLTAAEDYGAIRVTVDVEEDYHVVRDVLARLGQDCSMDDIVRFWQENPSVFERNKHVERNAWRRKAYNEG